MSPVGTDTLADEGRLVDNIVHFTRALRKSGVQVGTSQVKTAISAVHSAGFSNKVDFYYTLRATLITRPEHLTVFHQVFSMFWRDPEYLERMIHMLSPLLRREDDAQMKKKAGNRRAVDALTDQSKGPPDRPVKEELQTDARLSWSQNEVLRHMDFEQMSAAEAAEAALAINRLTLPVDPIRTRRFKTARQGSRPDIRATLSAAARRGGEIDRLKRKTPRYRAPKLVALLDISGSMSAYSRMLLHLLHGISGSPSGTWQSVNAFTFGTQLTNITNALQTKDVDETLAKVGQMSPDWQGGTRIGEAMFRFNRDWSRRVLGQGTVVLLITDGLERGDVSVLNTEIGRLSRSCRTLIWLNPLLRWEEFAPKAAGIKAILPSVDHFISCHSVDSLSELVTILNAK
ncbi:MAG: hypothetical protein ACI8YI_001803 [Paracoccaceae bacterium]